jgi:hypothetical protein
MRWWLGVALVAVLTPSPVVAGEGLIIGLSVDQLLSCGNFLVGPVQLSGRTFYKFATTIDISVAVAAGTIPQSESPMGCEAIVGFENGKVTTAEIRRLSRSPLACAACDRLFSDCKYLRR